MKPLFFFDDRQRALPWMRLIARVFLAAAALQLTELSARPDQALELSGNDWHILADPEGKGVEQRLFEADPKAWIPATVPGNIQADLEAARLLKPISYGAGDPSLYEVARKDWWCRKDFTIPASMAGRRLTLVFDGVDHQCEVWLNGKRLGANAGMYRRFQFDVTEVADPGQINRLAVRLSRMPEQLVQTLIQTDKLGGSAFVQGIGKTLETLKEFKTPTNWSYDWGVHIWTLGIWKDVRLEGTGAARIDWTRVRTSVDQGQAKVRALLEIDSATELSAKARFQIKGHNQQVGATKEVALKKGLNLVEAELVLERPSLWWPSGHGEQPLYTLDVELEQGRQILDARSTRFGVRDVRWEHTAGAPKNHLSRFQLIINGRPVRMLGSNLIPADLLFGRMGPRTLHLIRHAKAAGMNTLRLWGGGVTLRQEAYDLADELGIMLVQEFPLANYVPKQPDPELLGNLEATVRNILRQVGNHPSIVEYGGGNELPWKSNSKHPLLEMLQKVVAEEDGRLFRATCPDLGAKHGPWAFDLRNTAGLYDSTDPTKFPGGAFEINPFYAENQPIRPTPMRYGEFGAQTLANLEVWWREIPPKAQWPIDNKSPVLLRKNVVNAVFTADYWLLRSWLEHAFGPLKDLHGTVEAGQFYGAEALRYAFDAMRRKGRHTGALFTWDYNEPCPNGAGSYLIDYDGRPLMNYDFLKQALAPVSLSLKYKSVFYDPAVGVNAELFLTSDAHAPAANLRWKWVARDRRGQVFAKGEDIASIEPLDVKSLGAIRLQPPTQTAMGPLLVELRLEEASGKLLTERLHFFGSEKLAGPFAGLLQSGGSDSDDSQQSAAQPLRRTTLQVRAAPVRIEGGHEVLELLVKNTGPMTAFPCEPHPLISYRTDLFIDNNHCFIPPGESRTITIRADRKAACGLSLAQTGWRISCWNADEVVVQPSADVLLAVGRRDKMCREFLKEYRSDPSYPSYLLEAGKPVRFEFPGSADAPKQGALLRIHTADQSNEKAVVSVKLNGKAMEQTLPSGLGIQKEDPAHLAYPETLEFAVPAGVLRTDANVLEVQVASGWFTWDSLEIVSK